MKYSNVHCEEVNVLHLGVTTANKGIHVRSFVNFHKFNVRGTCVFAVISVMCPLPWRVGEGIGSTLMHIIVNVSPSVTRSGEIHIRM